jgi:hypothetical protein
MYGFQGFVDVLIGLDAVRHPDGTVVGRLKEYSQDGMDFGSADHAMNELFRFNVAECRDFLPPCAWTVYLAFDVGEYPADGQGHCERHPAKERMAIS